MWSYSRVLDDNSKGVPHDVVEGVSADPAQQVGSELCPRGGVHARAAVVHAHLVLADGNTFMLRVLQYEHK